jgi:type I restriction enzyme S subunit
MTEVIHTPALSSPIPDGWRWSRLQDVCSLFDCPHSTPQLVSEGPYIVRSQDIRAGVFSRDSAACVSEQTYIQRTVRAVPSHGDLFFSREGTYFGIAAEVPANTRVCLGQRMVLLRPAPHALDFQFLKYWLNSPIMVGHVRGFRDGSVAERLNVPTIKSLAVVLPPIREQQLIGQFLSILDQKIELNRCVNETLEEIERAIFESWFGCFDRVGAGADLSTGWTNGKFGDVAENVRDQVVPSEAPLATPYIGLEHMPRRSISLSEWGRAEGVGSNKFAFEVGDILFGKLRPYFHKVGVAAVNGVCSTDILVIRPKEPLWFSFVLGHASSSEMVAFADAGSTGTKMPRTSWNELMRFTIAIPPRQFAEKFNNAVLPIVHKIRANIHESRTLASLRDSLLPKFMSGAIRIKDAEQIVEAHA